MWGNYETTEGKIGVISIDFGHSKARRPDKKQIKMGIGTANGTIVDAKVLSGNMSDKTYNKENIDDVVKLLDQLQVDKTTFYYIADSALFSDEILTKMKAVKMNCITRMPDNINEAKALIEKGVGENGQQVAYRNAHNKDVDYVVAENTGDYKGHTLKYAVVYSTALEPAKVKSTERKVKTEQARLDQEIKTYQKRLFACLDDATLEIELLQNKRLLKANFHRITIGPKLVEKKRPGRPSLDPSKNLTTTEYQLCITYQRDDALIQERIRKESTFVLASNYLILLTIMMLSVMEQVVRKGLKEEDEAVIGTGKKVKIQPTQLMILRIFYSVLCQVYIANGKKIRRLLTPLNDSQAKIIRYLEIPESTFAWNGS